MYKIVFLLLGSFWTSMESCVVSTTCWDDEPVMVAPEIFSSRKAAVVSKQVISLLCKQEGKRRGVIRTTRKVWDFQLWEKDFCLHFTISWKALPYNAYTMVSYACRRKWIKCECIFQCSWALWTLKILNLFNISPKSLSALSFQIHWYEQRYVFQ